MRKALLILMTTLFAVVTQAIPADPTPTTVQQSDGTTLTLRLVGDEFFHYNTTLDGYTVVQNQAGEYEYAMTVQGYLVPSGVMAHDAANRSAAELQLLAQVGKHVRSTKAVEKGRLSRSRVNGPTNQANVIDYSSFHGLIILINYTDKQFGMTDPQDFYDKMVNERDFSYFMFNGRRQNCTGSMRDYFFDQSGGIFDPVFDIVGPVDVNYKCTDHGGTSNSWRIFWAALDAVDGQVDFSRYDNDGDGIVDMVYFLVAGYSANYSGNNGGYLWPHKSTLFDYNTYQWLYYDGVRIGTYASSCEIYGWESQGYPLPLGIGTMCHEFSHVLGLPDLYDTDYSSQGQSHDPGGWDVMAGGGSYNYGRTPCAYSIWERSALGWNVPQVIDQPGHFALNYVGNTGEGFLMRTQEPKEFFIFDNRQNIKWDAYLPGHGMLIARVDSTNVDVWYSNDVNANPNHNYYELLRAGNSTSGTAASDPFPGMNNVTEITSLTTPNLMTWGKLESPFEIHNITESGTGVITFDVARAQMPDVLIEDFETMPVTSDKNAKDVMGRFCKWNFTSAYVDAPNSDYCNGAHAVVMVRPSILAMAQPLTVKASRIEFSLYNSSSTAAKFTVFSSLDGNTWNKLNNEPFTAPSKEKSTFFYQVNMEQPMYFRIAMTGGNDKVPCYVDDVKFYYTETFATNDVNGDGTVDIADVNEVINAMLGKSSNPNTDVNGDGTVDIADVNQVINAMLGK